MRRARGFTLIEVLIATAVLALALGAFITGGARYADYARYIHDRTLAQWVARNQLVEYHTAEQWPGTGTEDGEAEMGDSTWRWVAEIEESPDPDVRRIDIRVFRIDGDSGDPEADSVALLSGFVTQNVDAADAPAGADGAGDTESDDASASGLGS